MPVTIRHIQPSKDYTRASIVGDVDDITYREIWKGDPPNFPEPLGENPSQIEIDAYDAAHQVALDTWEANILSIYQTMFDNRHAARLTADVANTAIEVEVQDKKSKRAKFNVFTSWMWDNRDNPIIDYHIEKLIRIMENNQ